MITILELLKEEYGGPGKYEIPEDHKAGMRVPKGGSCCATCEYWKYDDSQDKAYCSNTHYQQWAGTDQIPFPADEYCTDWYEPAAGTLQAD
jgi:hypothetical protein